MGYLGGTWVKYKENATLDILLSSKHIKTVMAILKKRKNLY